MNSPPILIWFRNDLRLIDNPALKKAYEISNELNTKILCVYIFEDYKKFAFKTGSASKWWLKKSLLNFDLELSNLDKNKSDLSSLKLFQGNPKNIFFYLIDKLKIKILIWNKRYETEGYQRDINLKKILEIKNLKVMTFDGSTLVEPSKVVGKKNQRLKIFTAYKNSLIKNHKIPKPLQKPNNLAIFKQINGTINLNHIKKNEKWTGKFNEIWQVGEKYALKKFNHFLKNKINLYNFNRDFIFVDGTSKLSPHLHFGEISPKFIWHKIIKNSFEDNNYGEQAFLSEIIWRDFATNLMLLFPNLNFENMKSSFNNFNWINNLENFQKWKLGETGYPLIDASMKQLWETGWMHNRARMIVASFLTKHLLINWQFGADWFHDTLVDADTAVNYSSWQWVAGCGADAAPFFRIFNPITQGKKFDKSGVFIKKYIKTLSNLDENNIHQPQNSKLKLNYPMPIVDHNFARKRALTNFYKLKKNL